MGTIREASDARLIELGCSAAKVGDYRTAQRRVARRSADWAASGARSKAWTALGNGVQQLPMKHHSEAKTVTRAPVDRSRTLGEVADEIGTAEAAKAEIGYDGISRAEVSEYVSAYLDRLLITADDALHASLMLVQSGRRDVDVPSAEGLEAPHGDTLGVWVSHARGQASTSASATAVLLLGKKSALAALAPHIAKPPAGYPADERAQRLAEITARLDSLYRIEAALLLDDDGDLRTDVDPRHGMDVKYLVLAEAP